LTAQQLSKRFGKTKVEALLGAFDQALAARTAQVQRCDGDDCGDGCDDDDDDDDRDDDDDDDDDDDGDGDVIKCAFLMIHSSPMIRAWPMLAVLSGCKTGPTPQRRRFLRHCSQIWYLHHHQHHHHRCNHTTTTTTTTTTAIATIVLSTTR
jgi:hypothetical protein